MLNYAQGLTKALLTLQKYHPVVIEGMGYYDPRDPLEVATNIHTGLQKHFLEKNVIKPPLIILQGDPLTDHGISAITPLVAKMFDAPRALVYLDTNLYPSHTLNADRDNVIFEVRYSELATMLEAGREGTMNELETRIDQYILKKNEDRKLIGKSPLKDYFRTFALLQEVTKLACSQTCSNITLAHTAQEISEFSVTSFYKVGLELGHIKQDEIVPYNIPDELNFDLIDKR